MDDETRHAQGMEVRRQVLGDAHVDAVIGATTPESEAFQDFVTRYAWGEIWSRPGLDRQTRSLVTIAVLAALGRSEELAMHLRAARRGGVPPAQLTEVLLHTAVYAGLPNLVDEDELEALVLGARWVERQQDEALAKAARNALAKIATAAPEDLTDNPDLLAPLNAAAEAYLAVPAAALGQPPPDTPPRGVPGRR